MIELCETSYSVIRNSTDYDLLNIIIRRSERFLVLTLFPIRRKYTLKIPPLFRQKGF